MYRGELMPAPNTWICRGCWKPNRLRDERCFMCKLPRDADPALVKEQVAINAARAAVADPVPDILITLPATLFRWYARLLFFLAAVLLILGALIGLGGGEDANVMVASIVGGAYLGAGLLFRFLANGMEDRNPWAFLVAFLVAGAAATVTVMQLFVLPTPVDTGLDPQATAIESWVTLIISASAAACALMGLVLLATKSPARA